ncbi:MAG TPA: hypothetical protein VF857_11720, partial [Spirochaetota bacterium]
TNPTTFTLTGGDGVKTLYAYVRDNADNVSPMAMLSIMLDRVAPVVTSFAPASPFPAYGSFVFNMSGTDQVGVVGWKVTETPVQPAATDSGWNAVSSASPFNGSGSYLPVMSGTRNLHMWLKDEAGNVSAFSNASYFTFIFAKNPWASVLIRDTFNDTTGNVPVNEALWMSPDIIPWGQTPSGNPISDFSNYGSTYYQDIKQNVNNYLYVRVKNMGPAFASGVAQVYLYWSDATLFDQPSNWINNAMTVQGTGLKTNPLPAMNTGDVTVTLTPFVWKPTMSGHICLIAVVSTPEHPWDPVNPLKFVNAVNFTNFVGYSPYVCWKNLSIVQNDSVKDVFVRTDRFNNDWKEDLPVMVGVTVRNLPVGTTVRIENKAVGIKVEHITTKPEEVIMSPQGVIQGGVKSDVVTTVQLPKGERFPGGAQVETSAYIGKPRKPVLTGGRGGDTAVATPVFATVKLADNGIPEGFTRTGVCSTLFADAKKKEIPEVALKPVKAVAFAKPVDVIKPQPPVLKPPVVQGASPVKKPVVKSAPVKKAVTKTAPKGKKSAPKKTTPKAKKIVKKPASKKTAQKKVGTRLNASAKKGAKPSPKKIVKKSVKKISKSSSKKTVSKKPAAKKKIVKGKKK